ncbi:MAG: hypothetical protein FWC47_13840 [Oscillospiraceae bacterium]|nr:hypothetical protein [Oscillospiraceae bacterium]
MIELLKDCLEHKKVTSIYTNRENTEKHMTGFISGLNEAETLISHMNSRGEYDGYILIKTRKIYQIDYDGPYEKMIKKLYVLKSQKHSILDISEENILFSLLKYAIKMNFIITVELEDTSYSGYVTSYNDEFVTLRTIDMYGGNSGISAFKIDEILLFACDTDTEQDLKLLNSHLDTDN